MKHSAMRVATLGLINLVLIGCAGTKETVLPQDGPTMKGIYEGHLERVQAQAPDVVRGELGDRCIADGPSALAGYTRDAFKEIDVLFPRLPNPTLVMYVFPHLAGETAAPVPGYATAFPMYEQVEYALPGELPGPPAGEPW